MSDLLSNVYWLIPVSVFLAGFIGSPHCVMMCGPLAMTFGKTNRQLAFYQFGRMVTYTLAGALAGSFGHVTLGSPSKPVSLISLAVLASMILITAWMYLPQNPLHIVPSKWFEKFSRKAWASVTRKNLPPIVVSLTAGALTVLLPCAHLYAFLLGAAATGSPLGGTLFMFTFWVSTLPALGFAPVLLRQVMKVRSGKSSRRWASGILVLASFLSLAVFSWQLRTSSESPPVHHHHHP